MKFRQLEAVRAVASTGTTTHGAELLRLTQSAVSRSIKELEDELGMQVFQRRHGKMAFTPEGLTFYREAEQILLGVERIHNMTRDIRTMQAGTLRIASMPSMAFGILPSAVAEFCAKHKRVKVSLEIRQREELEDRIAIGQADLGIATLPFQADGVEVEPLFSVAGVCVLPPEHKLVRKKAITAQDLEGESFVSIDLGPLLRFRIDEIFGTLGVNRDLRYEAQSSALICHLVASGLGVSIVHPSIAEAFGNRLAIRRFEPTITFDYALLYPAAQPRSLIARGFSELLHSRSKQHQAV